MAKAKTVMARIYAVNAEPIRKLHAKMLAAWEKHQRGPKPWFADAFHEWVTKKGGKQ